MARIRSGRIVWSRRRQDQYIRRRERMSAGSRSHPAQVVLELSHFGAVNRGIVRSQSRLNHLKTDRGDLLQPWLLFCNLRPRTQSHPCAQECNCQIPLGFGALRLQPEHLAVNLIPNSLASKPCVHCWHSTSRRSLHLSAPWRAGWPRPGTSL